MLVTLLALLCAAGMTACETDMEAELLVMFVVVPDLASDGPLLRTEHECSGLSIHFLWNVL